jgi:polar amino acid transport system substrate-binding protein
MNTHQSFFRILLVCMAIVLGWSLTLIPMAAAENRPNPQPGTLKSVLENGTLRVGVSLFTPWTLKTKKGDIVGYEIDVAKQLAKDLGVKPEFHVFDWEKIIPSLLNREIDIIIAGIVITPQRALKVNFSQPYDSSGIGLVTNISLTKTFKGPKDLNRPDVIIASVTGTISEDLARRVFSKAALKTFATSQEAIEAVTSGKVHGYVEHEAITTFVALDHPELVDEPLSKPLLETKAGFAVHKGDPDFINFLNAWIISHEADTWLASVHKYWFDSLDWQKEIGKVP